MSESKGSAEKPGRDGGRKPLSLQRTVESGHVQQKISHGRSKSVVVEKKRKRALAGGEAESPAGAAAAPPAAAVVKRAGGPRTGQEPARSGASKAEQQRSLSQEEVSARARALAAAQVRALEEERQRKIDAERRSLEEAERAKSAPQQASAPAAAAPAPATAAPAETAALQQPAAAAAPEARPSPARNESAEGYQRRTDAPREPARRAGMRESGRDGGAARTPYRSVEGGERPPRPHQEGGPDRPASRFGMTRPMIVSRDRPKPRAPEISSNPDVAEPPRRTIQPRPVSQADDDDRGNKKVAGKQARSTPKSGDDGRMRGRLTITNAFDETQRQRSLASLKRKRERERLRAMGIAQPREKITREVIIPEAITIQELANRMTERAVDVIKYLMKQEAMHQINDVIDADTAELIVQEFGHTPKRVSEADVEEGFIGARDEEEALAPRAPVVTIMGHVDHGKTSLLDAIREANVASGEAGGITQHIGAYQVKPKGRDGMITFIDTPGHEAFTAMRARGAKVTDIVVLVVAADDGVMPQTVEAINHAKAAGVPIIVAINKIDKPGVDPGRVRNELLQHEIVVESLSGEVQDVEVSALKKINIDGLLEAIALQAEILELKANRDRSAEGFVIEAKLERGRGPVGTLLVQRGTLRVGDIVVAGAAWGRVRALLDEKGANVGEAGPSVPVEVLGFDSAPEAGDQFAVVESEARAREITDYRARKRREALGSAGSARTLEQMMQQLKDAGRKEFPLVIKGDVQGSVEAIVGALKKLTTEEVDARIVHSGVGGITESDIALAAASKAIILGFNVRANTQAKAHAERDGVEIRYYNIIYDLVDEVKAAMSGLLAPTRKEVFLGYATIKQVFNITKVGKVAGCIVTEGRVERGAKVRLLRDKVVIHEGTLSVLKRFKDDVKEVQVGQECGMSFANYQDIREGDEIECFNVEMIQRTL